MSPAATGRCLAPANHKGFNQRQTADGHFAPAGLALGWKRKASQIQGNENNRWLFAATGLAIQMHQLKVYRLGKSTWNIKEQVWG